jgi:hypothetical protein
VVAMRKTSRRVLTEAAVVAVLVFAFANLLAG